MFPEGTLPTAVAGHSTLATLPSPQFDGRNVLSVKAVGENAAPIISHLSATWIRSRTVPYVKKSRYARR